MVADPDPDAAEVEAASVSAAAAAVPVLPLSSRVPLLMMLLLVVPSPPLPPPLAPVLNQVGGQADCGSQGELMRVLRHVEPCVGCMPADAGAFQAWLRQ